MKNIFWVLFLLCNIVYAGVSEDEALSTLKGRYQLSFDGNATTFLIRSTGKVQLLSEDSYVESGEMYLIESSGVDDYHGLPVAHLVFAAGSDEDTANAHIILVVSKDWDSKPQLQKISSFITFNDGPNDVANAYSGMVVLKKYNKKTKKYEAL